MFGYKTEGTWREHFYKVIQRWYSKER